MLRFGFFTTCITAVYVVVAILFAGHLGARLKVSKEAPYGLPGSTIEFMAMMPMTDEPELDSLELEKIDMQFQRFLSQNSFFLVFYDMAMPALGIAGDAGPSTVPDFWQPALPLLELPALQSGTGPVPVLIRPDSLLYNPDSTTPVLFQLDRRPCTDIGDAEGFFQNSGMHHEFLYRFFDQKARIGSYYLAAESKSEIPQKQIDMLTELFNSMQMQIQIHMDYGRNIGSTGALFNGSFMIHTAALVFLTLNLLLVYAATSVSLRQTCSIHQLCGASWLDWPVLAFRVNLPFLAAGAVLGLLFYHLAYRTNPYYDTGALPWLAAIVALLINSLIILFVLTIQGRQLTVQKEKA